jgi:hypothetical protein
MGHAATRLVPRRLVVALTLLWLLPLGCTPQQASGEVTREETASAANLTALRLVTDNASVTVETWERPDVTVSARVRASGASSGEVQQRLDATRLVLRPDGTTLGVDLELPPNRAAAQSFTVRLPTSLALDVRTTNGPVSVSGVRGALDVHTVNGPIDVNGAASRSVLETTNGSINVRLAAGGGASLDLETTNGAISAPAAGAQGGRRLQTAVGAGGPAITARAVNGSITVTQGS